jgi:hypothetical protein
MSLTCYGCGQKIWQFSPMLFFACRTWGLCWVGLMCSVLVTGVFPSAAWAEGRGRIHGVLQREGQGFAEQRIMLIRFGPNQEVQRIPGQTDIEGRFLFDHLETGTAFTYFVGVRYQEQLRRSDPIRLQSDEPVEVVLDVGESTAQKSDSTAAQPKLYIANHIMVIVGRDTHLEVREIVRIVNPGALSSMEGGVSLRLPLPLSYYNLSPVQGLAAEHVRVDATGLSYGTPLAPGEHQVIYTYHLPWHDNLATILVERTMDTSILDILVDNERFVTTSDLQFGGPVSIEPHVFTHFRGMNLGAHSRSWLQLMPHQATVSFLSIGAYSLVIGIMLLGVILPLHNIWYGRVRPEKRRIDSAKHEQIQELKVIGRNVLQSIALLDDQHENGTIGEVVYQQRRQAYKEQLFSLAEQFQRVQER